MYLQKVISLQKEPNKQKTIKNKLFFADVLKVTDEKRAGSAPDLDPIVRGRIRGSVSVSDPVPDSADEHYKLQSRPILQGADDKLGQTPRTHKQ